MGKRGIRTLIILVYKTHFEISFFSAARLENNRLNFSIGTFILFILFFRFDLYGLKIKSEYPRKKQLWTFFGKLGNKQYKI